MNKKVYILTILVFVMAINAVFSQTTTKKLSYQAVVRNAANELVVNQNLSVEITILNANNVPQYKETHATVPTNQNGLLWLWVGDGTPTLGTMDNVVWKDATIRSVFTLPDGSTVTQNTPVTAMPYAYFADEVDTIFLQNYLDTHDYVPDDYVTHPQLNDTLTHYYTNNEVNAILNAYTTNTHLNDTLSHYLMQEVQILSISHDTIFLTGGSFVKLPAGFSGNYHDLVDTPTNVSVFNNDAGYLTEHQSLEGYVTNDKLKDTLNSYYTKGNVDTKLNDYEKKSELCGDVKECIKDTLAAYYDTTRTQSVISDTATALRAMMGDAANDGIITIDVSGGTIENPTFSVNQANNQTVKITIPEAIPAEDGQLTIIAAGDTTRFTANQATNDTVRLNKFATKDTLAAYYDTTHTKDVISDTATALRAMMVDAANDGQLTIIAAGDTTRFTANQATNDTIRLDKFATKDTLAAYYDTTHTKDVISDTATALRAMMGDAANDATITIDVSGGTIENPTFSVNQANNQTVKITIPETIPAEDGQLTIIAAGDTTRFTANQATNDTVRLNKFATKDTLAAYYDTTHTKDVISDTATALRAMMVDAANDGQLTIIAAGDTTRFTANQATNDTVRLDKFATKEALKDTAKTLRGIICDSATACIKKALADPTSEINYAIDTIARHNIHDTAVAIRNSIGNGTLTIQKNGSTVGTFTANQVADQTVDIAVPTKLSQLANDGGVYAKRDSVNVFTNVNNFTSTVTVPSNTTTIPRPTTAAHPCTVNTANAVNICDLLAVFDSLTNKMNNILKTIDTLKHVNDSLAQEIASLKPSLTVTGPSSTQYLCGGANTITFDASITNANADDYSFSWTINGSVQSSTDATMHYTPDAAGAYKVICTATRSGYTTLKDSTTVNVSGGGEVPKFGICIEGRTVTVKSFDQYLTTTVIWGDGAESVVTANDKSHEYTNTGNYTIIAYSTAFGNCKMSWPVTITETTPNPCTVSTPHTNTSTYTATTGGLESVVNGKVESVQDQDGHSYYVVQIGNQCWMRTNLRTSKYNDGTTIPGGENCSSISPTDPYHYINPSYDASETGYFYNWPAASKKICPKGWRVPSQEDWTTLLSAAGVSAPASTGTGAVYLAGGCDWADLTPGPTAMTPNSYENQDRDKWGFTAIPAGRSIGSTFLGYSQDIYFWTSTVVDADQAKTVYMGNYTGVENNALDKEEGRLVRCVRSEEGSEDPYLSLTASPDDETVLLCGTNIHTVTYTATIENDDASGYMFSWIVNGSPASEDGTSITRSWGNTGNHTVVCVATNGNTPLKDTVITSVTIGSVPDFEDVHIDALTVRLELPVGVHDVDSVAWGDNAGEKVPHDVGQVYHTYQTGGDYTITAYSVEGCTSTTNVSVAAAPAFACGTATVSDADGNTYHTVAIGEGNNAQCWMKENLRTTKYADGTTIAQGSNHSTSEAYWYYPNNNANNKLIYGLLYNWKAVMRAESSSTAVPSGVQGICPEGWHVPSDQELQYLISNSSSSTATGKLAGGGSGTWTSSTTSATPGDYDYSERNSSGFSALPAGCYDDTYYDAFGTIAYFWSSTANPNYSGQSDYVALYYNQSTPNHNGYLQENGYSVRCVLDATSGGGGGSQTQTDPSVTTGNADPVGETTATLSATITNPDNVEITGKGFEYKRTSDASYAQVSGTGTGNSFTADLTGLDAGTEYTYHAFITTASGMMTGDEETFTTESGSVTPPTPSGATLSVTSDASSALTVCTNGTKAATYTATVTENATDVSNNYTYMWNVSGDLIKYANGNTCTVIYNKSGDYTVTCIATPKSGSTSLEPVQENVTVTESTGAVPMFGTCESGLTVSLEYWVSQNASMISWGDGAEKTSPAIGDSHVYASAGVYTITAVNNNDGCTWTKVVSVGNAHPCSVSSIGPNESGFGTMINTVTDIDNNPYQVVQIGSQCWMAQNLRTIHFANGDAITLRTGTGGTPDNNPYYCYPTDFDAYDVNTYGLYYNRWAALKGYDGTGQTSDGNPAEPIQGVCPDGWHIPSKSEWEVLVNSVKDEVDGDEYGAGKFAGGCDWDDFLGGDVYDYSVPSNYIYPFRNISGFNALPAGQYEFDWGFDVGQNTEADFWSSSFDFSIDNSSYYMYIYDQSTEHHFHSNRHDAFSVRCVRDAE